jgi:hypothetical protein
MTCKTKDCKKRGFYAVSKDTKDWYCFDHKKPEHFNVYAHYCETCLLENKRTMAHFGNPTTKKKTRCSKHVLPDDIYLSPSNRCGDCLENGIVKQASFGYPNTTKRIKCKEHHTEGMVEIITVKCEFPDCDTQPVYNYPKEEKGRFCQEHSLPDMINVKDTKCITCNKTIAKFNHPGNTKGIYCSKHKLDGMIDIFGRYCEICVKDDNYRYATFGFEMYKPLRCLFHSTKDMTDVMHKQFKCSSCWLDWRQNKQTQVLCFYCNPKTKKQKKRELEIKKLLEKNNISFTHDKVVANNCCLRYRPDFLIDCGSHFVIIEVDEDAHSSYPQDCEVNRMNNICFSLGLPTKFIRYNPDNKEFSKKIKQQTLIDTLKDNLQTCQDIEVVYLFY